MAAPTWYCPACERHYRLSQPRCTKCGIQKPDGEWKEGVRVADESLRPTKRPEGPRPLKVKDDEKQNLASIEKKEKARSLVRSRLRDDEVLQHVTSGLLYRGHWFRWYLLGYSPLFLLGIAHSLGARSGALVFLMAFAWGILFNLLRSRNYLIATTDQRLLLIGIKLLRVKERNHSSWPLSQTSVIGGQVNRHDVRFELQTPERSLGLQFGDKSSAAAVYNELLRAHDQTEPPPRSPANEGPASSSAWLRNEPIRDYVVISVAVALTIWAFSVLVRVFDALLTSQGYW